MLLLALLSALLVFSPALPVAAYSAKSYAVVEAASGRVVEANNARQKLPMASTTKIMTALLAVESGKLDQTVTVPAEAIRVEGSSMGLVAGEKITLRSLVYGLLLESGNDAANTIAYALSGSVPAFAERMNARAFEAGLYDTHFANPSGLDDPDHYTTALDLARLGALAMKNPAFAQIAGTQRIRVTYNGAAGGRTLVNHNRLLKSYEGAIGIKTGFTKKCGRCLVSCAQRDGVRLVVATLDDPDDWDDHARLLDGGFNLLKSTPLFSPAARPEVRAKVVGGLRESVACDYDAGLAAGLTAAESVRVRMQIDLPRFVYAPVKKGQKLGQIVFQLDGAVVAETDLTARSDVGLFTVPRRNGFFSSLWRDISEFLSGLFGG